MRHTLFQLRYLWKLYFYYTTKLHGYKYKDEEACLYCLFSGLNSVYQPCYYDGELIPRGTSVTRNCLNCYCGANRVVSCCSWVTISLNYCTNCINKAVLLPRKYRILALPHLKKRRPLRHLSISFGFWLFVYSLHVHQRNTLIWNPE